MTPAIDKIGGRGLINTARRVCLPNKTKVMRYQLQDYPKDRALQ